MIRLNKIKKILLKSGFTFNVEKKPTDNEPIDKYAEFDSEDTIKHIILALKSTGNSVIPIESNKNALNLLIKNNFDVIFNIAEGLNNSIDRESVLPAIFEFLNIFYAGSGPLTLAISLDKPTAKKIWTQKGISTPRFQIIYEIDDLKDFNLNFPVIVKPAHEGTSRGIFNDCYTEDFESLKKKVRDTLSRYEQAVIIEEFIDGREFTVTIIGNEEPYEILPPVEISFEGLPGHIMHFCSYEVKTEFDYLDSTVCPADITPEQENKLKSIALQAYKAIKTRDFGRVDIRLDKYDNPYVIEINPLPGMSYSPEVNHSMIKAAKVAGYDYNEYIIRLLSEGIKRGGKN
jgi:D-alanine-D-alanine ligase